MDDSTYYREQISPVLKSARGSEFKAVIKIGHGGVKTNYMDVSVTNLEAILDLLSPSPPPVPKKRKSSKT